MFAAIASGRLATVRRTSLAWVCALALLCFASPARAQNVNYLFENVGTYAGALETIPFRVSTDVELNAVDVVATYGAGMTIVEVNTLGTVIGGTTAEVFLVDIANAGDLEVSVVLDSTAPFDTVIAVGTDQQVLNVVVDVDPTLAVGAQVDLTFVGLPALVNVAQSAGVDVIPATLTSGGVTIALTNTIQFADTVAAPGDLGHEVEILIDNADDMGGFSAVGTFDATYVQLQSFSTTNTITDMVGAEYVEEIVDNTAGEFIIGVILDLMPPFNQQVIPATGQPLAVGALVFDILPAAAAVLEVPLGFNDNLGTPPVQNVLVFDQRSIFPVQQDGSIELLQPAVFLRGDANDDDTVDVSDGVVIALYAASFWTNPVCQQALDANDNSLVDLADAVYLLAYLFQAGPVLPAPFPVEGIDPTDPFALPCDI